MLNFLLCLTSTCEVEFKGGVGKQGNRGGKVNGYKHMVGSCVGVERHSSWKKCTKRDFQVKSETLNLKIFS